MNIFEIWHLFLFAVCGKIYLNLNLTAKLNNWLKLFWISLRKDDPAVEVSDEVIRRETSWSEKNVIFSHEESCPFGGFRIFDTLIDFNLKLLDVCHSSQDFAKNDIM